MLFRGCTPARCSVDMQVGFNYPWSHGLYGYQIGPDSWGKIPSQKAPWAKHIDCNLEILKKLGIKVIRWFLLGDGINYGNPTNITFNPATNIYTSDFDPPNLCDSLFKQHSGEAIYGLLTRNTNLWEELYSQPVGNDDWKKHALTVMVEEVAKAKESEQQSSEPTLSDAEPMETTYAQFQPAGNPPSVAEYKNILAKRKGLFRAYMDAICGPKFILDKNKFLAQGEDWGGKGDYQGCSEFNPLLLFSQTEEQELC